MMSFAKSLVLFLSLVAGVNALATPHVVRHSVHHRAIAARVPEPQPVPVPVEALVQRAPRSRRRCRRPASSIALSSTPVNSPTAVLVNAAPIPSTTSTSTTVATTSSVQKPKPATTTQRPNPAPTTTPPVTPTTKAAAPLTGNLPSFMTGTQTGQGTFYDTGLGACGIVNKDTDYIAAVSHLLFDNFPGYTRVNPNKNPMCGRTVTARYKGKSVKVALTDRCTGCALTDLDFSPSAFAQLADFSLGRISGVTWTWDD